MKRAFAVIAALAGAVTLLAQMKETVNVNVVEVPVTVVDAAGDPVRGLTAANFELYDNGTKRDITGFDAIDFASAQSMTAISPLNPNARRQFMLLFDLGYSSPAGLQRAQDAARKFVTENVKPRDLVAVATIEPDRGFRLVTAFTTDRPLIAAAIDDPRAYRGADPLQIASNTVAFEPTGIGGGGKSGADAAAEEAEMAARLQRVNEGQARQRIEREVNALGALASMLRAVPGRKQIVLLSQGFDAKYLEGRDARATQEGFGENEAVLRGQAYSVDNDQRYGNTTSQKLVDVMAQYFKQSDVVLNAIDIQGVRVQNDVERGAMLNSNAALFLLSRPTGGEVFENANDLKTNFEKMLHQQEVVYVLSFQAPSSKPGTFHNLKVKLVNVANGARANSRAGYFEGGAESAPERALSNAEIIVNDIPQHDLSVHVLPAAFPMTGTNLQVPVVLEIPGSDLTKDLRGNGEKLEVYIYAFDADGIVRDRLYQTINLDLRKVGDKLRSTGLKYYATLALPPGQYAIKTLVHSVENDKRGFARADIVIPKPGELVGYSAVPIEDQMTWVPFKGDSHAPNAPYPFVLNGQQVFPTTMARDKVALFVYGAKTQDLTWQTTPQTKFLGRADGTDGAAALVLQLPSGAKMSSLDITVAKKGTNDTRKVSVPIAQ
ncbi:MAG TPA: VWA domain-containing protein [Thermoanaerobaculia bacterium]|nr:VWA domain-containing protein [Thermoanaerobaculia bacterium]